MSKGTKQLSLSAVFCALAVVILCIGTVIPIGTYACPMLASFTLLILREECEKRYAWSAWAVTAVLSLLLAPDKEAAMLWCVLGWYPLVQPRLNKIKPQAVRLAVKLLLCAASTAVMYAVLIFLFQLQELITEFRTTGTLLFVITVILALAVFVMYDYLLPRLTVIYKRRKKP